MFFFNMSTLFVYQDCEGKCTKTHPVKCGNICHTEREKKIFYECDGNCTFTSHACKGKCLKETDRLCGQMCVPKNATFMQECNGQCINSVLKCNGKCAPSTPKACGLYCMPEDATCPLESKTEIECTAPMKKCGNLCIERNDTTQHEVEGQCLPTYLFCNGKCASHLPHKCKGGCGKGKGGKAVQVRTS